MDNRTPLKDLQVDNIVNMHENCENPNELNSLSKTRISIIKAFDPFYESPIRCAPNQIISTEALIENGLTSLTNGNCRTISSKPNDENCDPKYATLLNFSAISEEDFINDVREFAEGIIMEAMNAVFCDESVILNDTFYKTADPLSLENTIQSENNSEIITRTNENTNHEDEKLIEACNHEEEFNYLKSQINELLKQCALKDEELANTKTELDQIKNDYEKRETLLEKLQEEISNERVEHKKELESLKEDRQVNTEVERSAVSLQIECQGKDAQILQLKSDLAAKEREFHLQIDRFDQLIQSQLEEMKRVRSENEVATRHLSNLEIAFADVLQKYERSKLIIDGYKKNEDNLQSTLQIFEENLKKYDEKLEAIKRRGVEEISRLRTDVYQTHEERNVEINRLVSKIKQLEIMNCSLINALDQKTIECQELTKLWDETNGPTDFYK